MLHPPVLPEHVVAAMDVFVESSALRDETRALLHRIQRTVDGQ